MCSFSLNQTNARDWLGLDLLRVGRVGPRLSTSQLVGYVALTADNNPGIVDTSDREGLSSSKEVAQFEQLLRTIVRLLENERNIDRVLPGDEQPMDDLFSRLSARELISNVTALARTGASARDVIPMIRTHDESLTETRDSIKDRFVYYSRLATVGTIAQMLVHEIRNRTTSIRRAIRTMIDYNDPIKDDSTELLLQRANDSTIVLETLADTFAPLANRNFTRRSERLILEDRIERCLQLDRANLRSKEIECHVPESRTVVVADPGELDAILLNVILNASYWLGRVEIRSRRIEFELEEYIINDVSRVHVSIHDSGPRCRNGLH